MNTTPVSAAPFNRLGAFLRSRVGSAVQVAIFIAGIFVLQGRSPGLPIPLAMLAALLIWLSGDSWDSLGLGQPPIGGGRWALEGVVIGLLCAMVSSGLLTPLLYSLFQTEAAPPARQGDLSYLIQNIVAFGIIHALAKGLAYRSFLLNRLEALFGPTRVGLALTVAGASILFGLGNLRQDQISLIIATLVGVVFNLVFYWSKRNVWSSILAHGVYNTTLFALVFLGRL